jgi:ech hydrogenase subunit D
MDIHRRRSAMATSQEITAVESCDLVGIVAGLYSDGYRLVQIGCSTLPLAYELTYSFDKDYRLINYRITVAPEEEVPSVSVIYPNAFLYENEIHDLFGVTIRHITLDYGGTLYQTAISTPFSIGNVKLPEAPKKKAVAAEEKVPQPVAAKPGVESEGKAPGPETAKRTANERKALEPEAAKAVESEGKDPGPQSAKGAGSEEKAPGPEAAKGAASERLETAKGAESEPLETQKGAGREGKAPGPEAAKGPEARPTDE